MRHKILVTGGAGYIGSHLVSMALEKGYNIVVIDNFSKSNNQKMLRDVSFYKEDLNNFEKVKAIIKKEKPDSIIHLAGSIEVDKSFSNPILYYKNNTFVSVNLIKICLDLSIENFIFSSTSAVYKPSVKRELVSEKHPCMPISPYGKSKLFVEEVLKDVNKVYNLNYAALRYFNVCGMDKDIYFSKVLSGFSNLIKIVCETAVGVRKHICIYGTDYNTPDGTCQRDFIHVSDLVKGHFSILEYISNNKKSIICNFGNGNSYSVKEVINLTKQISGNDFKVLNENRRLCDPVRVIADTHYLNSIINWQPKYKSLKSILLSSLSLEKEINNI